ncbi:hypothetical protein BD310DRAFT_922930 [Dichomitus squalens]|uniref:Uncharacterized protein n=1 Tax=Dichomitus squalens TaxID=114155 RepID=A0A4Q9PZY1_9APHY|nr:hypothetical protein BD310DRAFT_922930 [Dichomitus squalens]
MQAEQVATQSTACHCASPALNHPLQNPHLSTPRLHPPFITRYNVPVLQHAPWALMFVSHAKTAVATNV